MKKSSMYVLIAVVLLGFGCQVKQLSAAESAVEKPLVIFMAGDSTMENNSLFPAKPQRGWGQMLPLYFKDGVTIQNLARGGRSSKSFRDEGRWQKIMDQVRPGDYVIIQFGHNDEKQYDPKRYTEPFGSFKENLGRFVDEVRAKQAHAILATSIVRRKFNNEGVLEKTHGDYPDATRQVARKKQVPLLELQGRSADLVTKLGPDLSKKMYMWVAPGEYESMPKGKKDDSHLNSYGAARICDLATDEIKRVAPDLAVWLR